MQLFELSNKGKIDLARWYSHLKNHPLEKLFFSFLISLGTIVTVYTWYHLLFGFEGLMMDWATAAAKVAVKLGSLVKEAIYSATSWLILLTLLLLLESWNDPLILRFDSDRVRSRVTVGWKWLTETEHGKLGVGPMTKPCGEEAKLSFVSETSWVCSPSYVAMRNDLSSMHLCTWK